MNLGVNRNKKSVAIDVKSPEGVALLEELIRSADVLVENFRPGTLERLGFGPDRARAINERLIYCSISGYGASGPSRDLPGHDMVIQGESGPMDVTGFPETGPTKVGVAITDCLAVLYAVQGILLAHISRARTGKALCWIPPSPYSVCRPGLAQQPGKARDASGTNTRRLRTSRIPRRTAKSSSQ